MVVRQSRRSSLVVEHIVNSDTLPLIEKDSARWRLGTESTIDGERRVTIVSMNPDVFRTYAVKRDSAAHMVTLRPILKKDSMPLVFDCLSDTGKDWQLEEKIGRDHVKLKLKKIDPDTDIPLLRVRRRIIAVDDEPE